MLKDKLIFFLIYILEAMKRYLGITSLLLNNGPPQAQQKISQTISLIDGKTSAMRLKLRNGR